MGDLTRRGFAEEVLAHKERYSGPAVKRLLKDPEAMRNSLLDGKVILYTKEDLLLSDHNTMIRVEQIGQMEPLIAAIYLGEFKLAETLLKGVKEGERLATTISWLQVENLEVENERGLREEMVYSFLLQRNIPMPLMIEILKLYAQQGNIIDITRTLELSGVKNEKDPLMEKKIRLLEKLAECAEELVYRIVGPRFFANAIVFLEVNGSELTARQRQTVLRILKKVYAHGRLDVDDTKCWLLETVMSNVTCSGDFLRNIISELSCTMYIQESHIPEIWKKVTGERLILSSTILDKFYHMRWDCFSAGGVAAMLLCCDSIIHDGDKPLDIVRPVVDTNSESMMLMTLKKDGITKEQTEEAIKYCKEKGNLKVIPLLLLKRHGEWPSMDGEARNT